MEACYPGVLQDAERQSVLAKLNAVRVRHGLLPVTYDASGDAAAAEAALYMIANETLTHSPVSSGKCYTAGASQAAGASNLYYGWYTGVSNLDGVASSTAIDAYLIDSGVPSLGHRRWILDPFLAKVSFGRVDGRPTAGSTRYYTSSTLKVIGNGRADVLAMGSRDYVAYPEGDYPAGEVNAGWFMSFSAIASKTSAWSNGSGQVNYAGAVVSVSGPGGALAVSEQSASYTGYGLANALQWKVAGVQTGVSYTVTISNVVVNGSTRNYGYSFRLQ